MDQVLIDLDDAWQDLSVKSLIAADAASKVTEAGKEAEAAFRDAHRDLLSTLMNSEVDAAAVIEDLRREPAGKLTIAISKDSYKVNILASATESAEALHNAFATWSTARDAASAFQTEMQYQNLFVEPDDYAEARQALLRDAEARQVLTRLRADVLDGLKRLEDRVAAKQTMAPVEPEPPAPPSAEEMASIMADMDMDESAPVTTTNTPPNMIDTFDEDLERFAPPTPRAEPIPPVVAAPVEKYQAPVRETPAPSSSTFKRIDMQTGEIFDEPALFDEEPPMKPAVSSVNQGAYPTAMPAAMPVKKNAKALPIPLIGGVLGIIAVVGGLWLGHGNGQSETGIVAAAPAAAAPAAPAVPPVVAVAGPVSPVVPAPAHASAPAAVAPPVVLPPAKAVAVAPVVPHPVATVAPRHVDGKPRASIEHRHTDSAADNAEVANASKALDRYFAPH